MRIKGWYNLLLPLLICVVIVAACNKSAEQPATAKQPVPPSSSFFETTYPLVKPGSKEKFAFGYYGNDLVHTNIILFMVSEVGDTFYRGTWKSLDILPDSVANSNLADEKKAAMITEALEKALHFPEKDIMNQKTGGKKFLFALPKEFFSDRWMWMTWDDKIKAVIPIVYYFGQKPHDEDGAWIEIEKTLKKKGML